MKGNKELYLTITFAVYAFQGFLITICNGIVALVLIKHRHLRRQYMILLAQIFVDALLGFGFCIAGIGRLFVTIIGQFRISRRYCLSQLMSAVATLMVSTDRIISLLFPMRYFENNYSYQIKQIIVYFGLVSLLTLIGCIISFTDAKSMLNGYCWSGDTLQPVFADLNGVLMMASASLSVIIYIIVYFLSRKHIRRIKSIRTEVSLQVFEARQRKLTITMGVSCVFTLIFYVLPLCFKLFIYSNDDPTTYYSELLRSIVTVSCNVNPLANIATILIKQNNIACHVKQLFPKCIQKFYKCNPIMAICAVKCK
ncbi:hypothetical protein DINM_004569 [Dirofilaria immitis]|nr:hypothetical protein [Dirofilaria immitis]